MKLRVAAVQVAGVGDKPSNLARAAGLVDRAAAAGARLVVLPELFACLGNGAILRGCAETESGETSEWAREVARRSGVFLLAGSYVERDGEHLFNTATMWDPAGTRQAAYRKIHLFDNDVPGAAFRESDTISPGQRRVTCVVDGVCIGIATCYDLRFPGLHAALAGDGARAICVPSAFMHATGQAHWEPLVRARAIENGVYVIAPDQPGRPDSALRCHGHSMIVDPWGTVLGQAGHEEETVIVSDLDFELQDDVRRRLPSLEHRRPDTYG